MTDRMAGFARELVKNEAARNSSIPTIMARTQLVPFPLVGIISPWNFPFLLGMIDSIPALIAGSAILYKPSEITPRHADPVRECFNQVPELADVVDYAMGAGATGQAVIDNVDAVCFTGSVRTGRLVAERAASNFIPAFLEMGGKDPAIVLESADLERTATVLLRGSVAATGQACQSVERIYVARPLHDALVARLAELAANVTLNTEAPDKGHIGPLIFEKQLATIQSHIDDAVEKGATLHCGGRPIEDGGTWYPATVLSGVNHSMRVMTDETFGPVLPVMAFDTVDEAVALANDSRYGLSASVFAGTEEEGLQVARRMHGGVISVNEASLSGSVHEFEQDPFNYSGLGRSRMGPAGVERFYRHKLILTDQSTEPRGIDAIRRTRHQHLTWERGPPLGTRASSPRRGRNALAPHPPNTTNPNPRPVLSSPPLARHTGGVWRRLVARLLWEQKVNGSNPFTPTKALRAGAQLVQPNDAPVAQPDRAPAF